MKIKFFNLLIFVFNIQISSINYLRNKYYVLKYRYAFTYTKSIALNLNTKLFSHLNFITCFSFIKCFFIITFYSKTQFSCCSLK